MRWGWIISSLIVKKYLIMHELKSVKTIILIKRRKRKEETPYCWMTEMLSNFDVTSWLVWVGLQDLQNRWKPLLVKEILSYFRYEILCVAPLWLMGLRGNKSTPIIGWEVTMNLSISRQKEGCCESFQVEDQPYTISNYGYNI